MEALMQYIWQHRLLRPGAMSTTDGRAVEILDPGTLNTGGGPDFFNAKVRIGGHLWAGDVEIHVRASDWLRHGHHNDRAYDSVVLHVVDADDMPVTRSNGEVIPQMRLPATADFSRLYEGLVSRAPAPELPCRSTIGSMPGIYLTDWLSALGMERIHSKVARVEALLRHFGNDWMQVLYVVLARGLGFCTNAEPLERLALATPLKVMLKHSDNPVAVEAILFGQSGLLDGAPSDIPYVTALRREWDFMRVKFGLRPPQSLGWKRGAIRPQNTPHRRIALLAHMVTRIDHLFSQILDASQAYEVMRLFDVDLSGFWEEHYSFSAAICRQGRGGVSKNSLGLLVTNVAVPMLFAYGEYRGDEEMCGRAVELLHQLAPETNSITALFTRAGIGCSDGFTSQALIQLRRNYCETRKCLYCRIGHRMLAAGALRR